MSVATCNAIINDLCDELCAYQTGVYHYGGFPACWETAILTEGDEVAPVLTWSRHPNGRMYMTRISAPGVCGHIKADISRVCLVDFLETNAAYIKIQNAIYHSPHLADVFIALFMWMDMYGVPAFTACMSRRRYVSMLYAIVWAPSEAHHTLPFYAMHDDPISAYYLLFVFCGTSKINFSIGERALNPNKRNATTRKGSSALYSIRKIGCDEYIRVPCTNYSTGLTRGTFVKAFIDFAVRAAVDLQLLAIVPALPRLSLRDSRMTPWPFQSKYFTMGLNYRQRACVWATMLCVQRQDVLPEELCLYILSLVPSLDVFDPGPGYSAGGVCSLYDCDTADDSETDEQ